MAPGFFFTDGSGGPLTSYPDQRRVAYGFVRVLPDGRRGVLMTPEGAPVLQAVVGALPGPKQTVPRGELMALLRVLQLVDPVEGKVTHCGG